MLAIRALEFIIGESYVTCAADQITKLKSVKATDLIPRIQIEMPPHHLEKLQSSYKDILLIEAVSSVDMDKILTDLPAISRSL
jgi:hypothetical protein